MNSQETLNQPYQRDTKTLKLVAKIDKAHHERVMELEDDSAVLMVSLLSAVLVFVLLLVFAAPAAIGVSLPLLVMMLSGWRMGKRHDARVDRLSREHIVLQLNFHGHRIPVKALPLLKLKIFGMTGRRVSPPGL